jgi:hypothetical protein
MWSYFGYLALFAVVAVFVWLFDWSFRRGRAFMAELTARLPVPDDKLFDQYFANEEMGIDIPWRVRRIFAKHMNYPANKLLPDDDLSFFWNDLDMIDLIRDLELEFGIEFTDADISSVPNCTIRAVSRLVSHKLSDGK